MLYDHTVEPRLKAVIEIFGSGLPMTSVEVPTNSNVIRLTIVGGTPEMQYAKFKAYAKHFNAVAHRIRDTATMRVRGTHGDFTVHVYYDII